MNGERTTTSTPYDPSTPQHHDAIYPQSFGGSRFQLAAAIGGIGCFVGAIICAISHFMVFMVLEGSFAPPLDAQENFGQFGFLTVYVGFFGALFGLSLGLIPFIRFVGWLPIFVLISLFGCFAEPIDFTTTAGFAMIIVAAIVLIIGCIANFGVRLELRFDS